MGSRSVAALAAWALCAPAAANDTFASQSVGFEVTKPAGWQFVSVDQNLENLKAAQLEDENLQSEMLKYATAPLVALMRHPEPFDDLNPSFKVNIRPLGGLKGSTATEILELIVPQFQQIFKDFKVAEAPRALTVSGLAAGYMRVNYSLQVADGRIFPTTSEVWIVPRGDYFFMIGAGTRQDEKTGGRSEIQSILQTVHIAH
jgi:hypothetical protein